jgi:hypothetical protein
MGGSWWKRWLASIQTLNRKDKQMRLNQNIPSEKTTTANDAMNLCMAEIHEILMQPMQDMNKLSDEQRASLSIIGITLKLIAEKATRFEEMGSGEFPYSNN